MDHVKALLIKFVMVAVVLGLVLTLGFNVGFGDTMLVSLVLTVVAYILGDLMIFRKAGEPSEYNQRNMIASFCDFVLTFIVIWFLGSSMFPQETNTLLASLISGIVIAAGEWFFHKYLDSQVFHENGSKHHTSNHPTYNH